MEDSSVPVIEAVGLKKRFGDNVAVDIESLKIWPGECLGLVGNNGAGKTTFFSLILDLIQVTGGAVFSKNLEVRGSEHWKGYTGSYLDEGYVLDFLSPEEYFTFVGGLYDMSEALVVRALGRFEDFFAGEVLDRNKLIRELSKGNQKKVGIAAALLPTPEIVLLDEPFPSLDPTTVNRLKALLRAVREECAVTLLISSHNLNYVTDLCDRIVILEEGKVVRDLQTSRDTLQQLEEYFEIR